VDGRRVRTLVNGTREAGEHRQEWDGRDDSGRTLGAGIYWARLSTSEGTFQRTVVLLRD
jgi:flagellar hook assembly protein FlgD